MYIHIPFEGIIGYICPELGQYCPELGQGYIDYQ